LGRRASLCDGRSPAFTTALRQARLRRTQLLPSRSRRLLEIRVPAGAGGLGRGDASADPGSRLMLSQARPDASRWLEASRVAIGLAKLGVAPDCALTASRRGVRVSPFAGAAAGAVGGPSSTRRLTGSVHRTVVPWPGADSISSVPWSRAARSRIPSTPNPSVRVVGSKPAPSSRMRTSIVLAPSITSTTPRVAWPFLTALVSASWTIRYIVISSSGVWR
jgi:hypothetical protein